jgi:hypothetical protein
MASKRHVAPCPNGKTWPEGTKDFTCYVHPDAGLGVAIALLFVLLGILAWLVGTSAAAMLRGNASRESTER